MKISGPNLAFTQAPKRDWTLLYVLNGDNDLRETATSDLLQLDKSGAPDGVAVVGQLYRGQLDWTPKNFFRKLKNLRNPDPRKHAKALAQDWRGMRVYEVRAENSDEGTKQVGQDTFTTASRPSSPEELTKFVAWGMKNYPAENFAVVLSGHGSGKGIMSDSKGDKMTFQEASQAIKDASAQAGEKVDLVLLDSCATASEETAEAFAGATDYLIGSTEKIRGDGWSEAKTMQFFRDHPGATPAQLAESLLDSGTDGVDHARLYQPGS